MRSVCVAIGFLAVGAMASAGEPVLELKVGDEAYVGCAVAHNDDVCWLAHDDGRFTELSVKDVTSFRKLGDDFRGLTSLEARNQLRSQLGRGWQVVGTGHYLVCTRTDSGREHAQHFEDLYRSFHSYFTRRGFELKEPKFPLIAIVFANRAEFAQQCREDDVPFVAGLRGYYSRETNRICLFEEGERAVLPQGRMGRDRLSIARAGPSAALLTLPPIADLHGTLKRELQQEMRPPSEGGAE